MGRLTNLKPSLGTLRPSVAYMPQGEREYDRTRDQQAWRQWYKTKRWQRLRWSVLVRDLFTCQMCGKLEANTSQLVADHKVKHEGIEDRFFDADGCQTLCAPCHSSTKQREEHGQ